jgi:single-stranded-DNA-specific exonuclease
MVPLVDENRILTTAGLRELSARRRPGLRALLALAECDPTSPVTATDVGFRIAPRLNAAGRLGEAQLALDVLLAADDASAERLAAELDGRNKDRQRIQEEVWTEALAAAEAQAAAGAAALVIGAEGWHPGVVGIIAARLVDRFARPSLVVGFEGGVGRGSARTTGGFNLYRALDACRSHLVACGGHAAAAGLTVHVDGFPAFAVAFQALAEQHRAGVDADPPVVVDAVVDLGELDLAQVEELARLAPFGVGNGEILLALPRVRAAATRVVGRGHLQLTLAHGAVMGDAIAFNMGDRAPPDGAELDVIACAEVDSFRGSRRSRLRVKHLLPVPS